jgi:hypothetical protein
MEEISGCSKIRTIHSVNRKYNFCEQKIQLLNFKTGGTYRGADKPLAPPGRKQATATEDFDVHIHYL